MNFYRGKIIPFLRRKITDNREIFLLKKFNSVAKGFISAYENRDYNFNTNGEKELLKKLGSFNFKTIFDVGANIGDWSNTAVRYFPNAEIHAFEIAEPTFQELRNNIHSEKIIINDFGLAQEEKSIEIKFFPDAPVLTTAYDFPHEDLQCTIIKGTTKRGSDYCKKHKISSIDFLKVDVEGEEHNVLKGFEEMLNSKSIRVIQFEYGQINIINKFLLRDFYLFFDSYGYSIGKIYPQYVDFYKYDFSKEDFIGPNFIAILNEEKEIKEKLSQRR
jgi:FkbM family methyltransferase